MVCDRHDHRVDFHTVTFDSAGSATQQLQDGSLCPYPPEGFASVGRIAGQRVTCLTATVQSLHHLGYDPDEKDFHDMRVLADRLGIDLPEPYRGDVARIDPVRRPEERERTLPRSTSRFRWRTR